MLSKFKPPPVSALRNNTGLSMHDTDNKLDRVVARAIRSREARERGYRAQSLNIHPWICGRCGREFNLANLHELTVHHKDHDHDNNPADGSNWEHLCLYCHDNEHGRFADTKGVYTKEHTLTDSRTHRPLAKLRQHLEEDRSENTSK